MLQFFRKYQKIVLILVAIFIIISFTFFGVVTGPTVEEVKKEDKKIGLTLTHTPVRERQKEGICQILSRSILDPRVRGELPHLMNEGILEKQWLSLGFAHLALPFDFDRLKGDLEKRIFHILKFRPYVHPEDPTLSALSVFEKYAPQIPPLLFRLQHVKDPLSPETYSLLISLYLAQTRLPPDLLTQVLLHEERERGLKKDLGLEKGYLGLFGFRSLEDWLGKAWLERMADYVLNLAALGEVQGYKISPSEARESLARAILSSHHHLFRDQELSQEEMTHYLLSERQRLGVTEEELISLWQTILLFERVLKEVGDSVFVDPLVAKTVQEFSRESRQIELIEVQQPFRLQTLTDLFLLDIYLEAIAPKRQERLDFPAADPLDQIVKRAPFLVERDYTLRYASISKQDLLSTLSTKETWEFEVDTEPFSRIAKKFSLPLKKEVKTKRERYEALSSLSSEERREIDQWAREEMLKMHPEKITSLLQEQAEKSLKVSLRALKGRFPLEEIKDVETLKALIVEAPLISEEVSSRKKEIVERLGCYTEEGELFYRIRVEERGDRPTLLSFEKAKEDGTLEEILNTKLEPLYQELKRKKSPLVYDKGGKVLPFLKVREAVGKVAFSDLLKAIEESYRSHFGVASEDLSSSFYTSYRFLTPLLQNPDKEPFSKATLPLTRSAPYPFAREKMFGTPFNTWSEVESGERGNLMIYRVVGEEKTDVSLQSPTLRAHELLSYEARRSFILDFLKKMENLK